MSLTALTATLKATLNFNVQRDATGKTTGRLNTDVNEFAAGATHSFAFGTASAECDQIFQDKRTLTASASEDLNISGGAHAAAIALLNPFGETISFSKIKGIYISVNTAAGSITIGGEATNDFTALFGANGDKLRISGGKFIIWNDAGYAVATDEALQITNELASSVEYEVIFVGNKV